MNMLKTILVTVMICTGVNAQGTLPSEAEKVYAEEMSLEMCRSLDHRFDPSLNECIYCAHGLHYDSTSSHCTGTPDVLGKCFGEDHYHAKTQECMYCAYGYSFDDDLKECIPVQEGENKK